MCLLPVPLCPLILLTLLFWFPDLACPSVISAAPLQLLGKRGPAPHRHLMRTKCLVPSKQLKTFLFLTESRRKTAEAADRQHRASHRPLCTGPHVRALWGAAADRLLDAVLRGKANHESHPALCLHTFTNRKALVIGTQDSLHFFSDGATPSSFVAFYIWLVVYILPSGVGAWSIRTRSCDFSWILGRVVAFARLRAHTQSTDVGEKNG